VQVVTYFSPFRLLTQPYILSSRVKADILASIRFSINLGAKSKHDGVRRHFL